MQFIWHSLVLFGTQINIISQPSDALYRLELLPAARPPTAPLTEVVLVRHNLPVAGALLAAEELHVRDDAGVLGVREVAVLARVMGGEDEEGVYTQR